MSSEKHSANPLNAPSKSEQSLMHRIMLALPPDVRAFRNNVGIAIYPDGSRVRYGLCPGSSDLIGWKRTVITPEMVGRTLARFLAIECKSDAGTVTEKQKNFLSVVRAFGGVAVVARSVADVEQALDGSLFDR